MATHSWLYTRSAVSMLVAGATLATLAGDPTTPAQPVPAATPVSVTPTLPFATPLRWTSTGVLVKPVSDETHTIVSVKDPTVVRYNNLRIKKKLK